MKRNKGWIRRVAAMAFLCVQAVVAADGDAPGLATRLAQRLEAAARDGFSGSVLVAHGDEVVFERQYGVADPATGAAVAPDTRFNLASTGKLFTAVAVWQLVERGKLDLDAPIGRYLPDWPVETVRDRVTPRQLLQHTSGLGSYWGPAFEARRATLKRLSDYRPLLASEPAFAPGTRWQYSNQGYLLLGLLVEAVSGEDYYDYVTRHVFAPADMVDSGYFVPEGRAEGVAVPHQGGTTDARDTRFPMPEPRGGAAGGGYSTPRDLWRFHRALTGGRLLQPQTLARLFAPAPLPAGVEAPPHALGVLRFPVGNDIGYGHPGGSRGVGVDFRATRDSDWVLIVMSNVSEPFAMPLAAGLAKDVAQAGGPDLASGMMPAGGGRRMVVAPAGR